MDHTGEAAGAAHERAHEQSQFDTVIAQDQYTLVMFFAVWSGPSKQISPVVEKLAVKHPEIAFASVDVDATAEIGHEVGVRGMPTFVLFRRGEKGGEVVGAGSSALIAMIDETKAA
ncbi:thioredoxin family protein [Streptomyces sp. NPDC127097]|uniref:thioredoxin family protein n=1 Tax=Streptomyces sp. NPDC127097 TaxID=3347136 RepID=UPI00364DD71A